jgi:hypothetical protein
MITSKTEKKYRKFKEAENNIKSLNKELLVESNWPRLRRLNEKDGYLHDLWYKRSNDLSYLLKAQ